MKKSGMIGGIVTGVVLFFVLLGLIICTKKIPVGYKGIIYSMNNGVTGETLEQGWHIVSPTKKVKLFTISNEQLILSKDSRDGSEENESFKVSTADDASISISFQMSYRFIEKDLTDIYKNFKMDGENIVNKRVKTVLKSKISEITTDYTLMDIYSGNRAEINNKITNYLNESFQKNYGIEVLDASIIDVHPDTKLKEAINQRVTALQNKQIAQAEQETAKVQAETKLIEAQNEADIKIAKSKAEAESKKIEAEAEAEANKKLSESITQELIDYKLAEARYKNGWIEVNGANTVVTEK